LNCFNYANFATNRSATSMIFHLPNNPSRNSTGKIEGPYKAPNKAANILPFVSASPPALTTSYKQSTDRQFLDQTTRGKKNFDAYISIGYMKEALWINLILSESNLDCSKCYRIPIQKNFKKKEKTKFQLAADIIIIINANVALNQ